MVKAPLDLCGQGPFMPHYMHKCCRDNLMRQQGAASTYPACPRCARHRNLLQIGADESVWKSDESCVFRRFEDVLKDDEGCIHSTCDATGGLLSNLFVL